MSGHGQTVAAASSHPGAITLFRPADTVLWRPTNSSRALSARVLRQHPGPGMPDHWFIEVLTSARELESTSRVRAAPAAIESTTVSMAAAAGVSASYSAAGPSNGHAQSQAPSMLGSLLPRMDRLEMRVSNLSSWARETALEKRVTMLSERVKQLSATTSIMPSQSSSQQTSSDSDSESESKPPPAYRSARAVARGSSSRCASRSSTPRRSAGQSAKRSLDNADSESERSTAPNELAAEPEPGASGFGSKSSLSAQTQSKRPKLEQEEAPTGHKTC